MANNPFESFRILWTVAHICRDGYNVETVFTACAAGMDGVNVVNVQDVSPGSDSLSCEPKAHFVSALSVNL